MSQAVTDTLRRLRAGHKQAAAELLPPVPQRSA